MKKTHLQADDCSPLEEAEERGEVRLVACGRGQYPGRRLEGGQLPGLRTIGYWDAVGLQTWGLPMHRNEGIEICYLLSGETAFATDSERYVLRPGDITITRPWQRHRLGDPNIRACKLFWFILDVESGDGRAAWEFPSWIGPDAESRRELLKVFRKNQRCQIRDEKQGLRRFMEKACSRLDEESQLSTARIANMINFLLLEVADRLSGDISDETSDPQGFDQTIREFFHGLEASVEKAAEPWAVADIAHACRVGVTYLTASCKEIFNTTPSEQLNKVRLFHAAKLLKEREERSVTDIAMATGFSTSQYFATKFRKQFGVTPQGYRK
ncbi:helix-turn-helix domain-containing protein [Pelagicoccus mobilis]|uniref:AraC family transcriptional regulator n=1 Tax=Pelagicoccus mobilis TaxID=415221 RepID=A0A934VJ72_9BACT|nr:helix-turn-helix domain-containing protein [Pelagicoccus mobilis]MBK1875301.1 AraC family transcriptional regulator [Pelagicoccus mobilis]